MRAWPHPTLIDTAFDNNSSIYWWQGKESVRLPENINWNFTVQRELPRGFLLEAGYAASLGEHLLANELDYNRININNLPANLSIYTNAGRTPLNTPFHQHVANWRRTTSIPIRSFRRPLPTRRASLPHTAINTAISGTIAAIPRITPWCSKSPQIRPRPVIDSCLRCSTTPRTRRTTRAEVREQAAMDA
jgi:hypothetical protein